MFTTSKQLFTFRQQNIEKKQISQRLTLPSLESFRWRVDVTISTRLVNKFFVNSSVVLRNLIYYISGTWFSCLLSSLMSYIIIFSVLNRVLEPTVLMEMKDSTGKITTFEVSIWLFLSFAFRYILFWFLEMSVIYICFFNQNLICKNI